ncbi:class I SAM-dependent methyltransferase [Pseudoduganella sp. UC29_106]|uniref:class I SAM-dependent methyltransferase n=1 Tax=Pseudoduganella sp. UC29_106 TaxID=3374553 RepID=UPI003757DFEE
MDRLIAHFDAVEDGDLSLCVSDGVAFQTQMQAARVPYDDVYFDKYAAYEDTPIANALNRGRCSLLARHAAEGATVLDIGAGCGTFVRAAAAWGFESRGFDVIPKTVNYLKSIKAYASDPAMFDVVTFWDSLEHIDNPGEVLEKIQPGSVVLVAIPIFDDLRKIRESKHYRPGEHLYYFTEAGFIRWMGLRRFHLLEISGHETDAGRESIGAYAFYRDTYEVQSL